MRSGTTHSFWAQWFTILFKVFQIRMVYLIQSIYTLTNSHGQLELSMLEKQRQGRSADRQAKPQQGPLTCNCEGYPTSWSWNTTKRSSAVDNTWGLHVTSQLQWWFLHGLGEHMRVSRGPIAGIGTTTWTLYLDRKWEWREEMGTHLLKEPAQGVGTPSEDTGTETDLLNTWVSWM